MSPGTVISCPARRGAGAIVAVVPLRFHIGAELAQHQLRVVAGEGGLRHAGGAVRIEPGQQDRGFYLGGGHLCPVMDAVQGTAFDPQGRAAVPGEAFDGSAHLGQGLDDAAHGPLLDGGVPGQRAVKVLSA